MPAHAAGGYLDHTFSRMMWFKTTSVYLALNAGELSVAVDALYTVIEIFFR